MEKNTVKTELLLKDVGVSITSVASFRNFVYVSGWGDKLLVYTIRKGRFRADPLIIVENGETKVSEPRIHENYFGCRSAAEEMIVDTVHQLLLCRTVEGVYVGSAVCRSPSVHRRERYEHKDPPPRHKEQSLYGSERRLLETLHRRDQENADLLL